LESNRDLVRPVKRDLELDPLDRALLAQTVLHHLTQSSPDSRAELIGSLAKGGADEYSDIDIRWEVSSDAFHGCIATLKSVLENVRRVESLRSDPDFQTSKTRRLLFVRFRDTPLFWPLDLEIVARSLGGTAANGAKNPSATGSDWSATESALANAVAAIKAHLRQNDPQAHVLLVRGYLRIGLTVPDLGLDRLVVDLVDQAIALDHQVAEFGLRIRELAAAMFPPPEARL
jgi:predicted nucleotidyltransferase